MNKFRYYRYPDIAPTPAPRMNRSDVWKRRPSVVKYHSYRDAILAAPCTDDLRTDLTKTGIVVLTFCIQPPKSWPKKRLAALRAADSPMALAHRQTPDLDNLVKGFLDAVFYGHGQQDSTVWSVTAEKVWGLRSGVWALVTDEPISHLYEKAAAQKTKRDLIADVLDMECGA